MAKTSAREGAGLRILLVEDYFLIAMDTKEQLGTLLQADIEVASTTALAFAAIEHAEASGRPFDVAVIDIDLNGANAMPLAEFLQDHQMPFIFATGYPTAQVIPERFRSTPTVSKPYDFEALALAVVKAASRAPN